MFHILLLGVGPGGRRWREEGGCHGHGMKTKAVLQKFKPGVMLQRPDAIESSSEEEDVDITDPPPVDVLDV